MWRETIAARRRRGGAAAGKLAARLLTGPGAFFVAGLLDVLTLVWWLTARRRSGRSFDAG